jgi:F-type H+-transporting ATPase subunit b
MHAALFPTVLLSEGGGFNPVIFDPAASLLTILTFFGLLVVLAKFAWKPILAAVNTREKKIDDALAKSAADRAEAAKLLEDHKRSLAGVEAELAALREKGRVEAEAMRREMIARAEKDATAVADKARRDIELARNQALQDIRREAVTLGIAVAGKVVGRSVDDADQRRIASEVVSGLTTVAHGGR